MSWAVAASLISLEATGMHRSDDEIDCAAAAARADETRGPFGDGEIGTVVLGLPAGINVNRVPAIFAPCPQKQIRLGRSAERRRPRGAFVAFSLHRIPISEPAAPQRE